ncbi:MAG: sugar phosphate isomerase/epimerase [Ruminococcaceae bacterium]|nr:sugar phosphate isomerase/epimerase [Oscillospiraceae bacterium]
MNEKISFYAPPFSTIKTYREMVDAAVEYGVSSLEGFSILDFDPPSVELAKEIREYADSKNIIFSCFSVYINLVGEDRKEKLEKLKKYADMAKVLGSPYLHHTIACEFSDPNKVLPYKEAFFDYGIEAVRNIYDYAASIGLRTIYEEQGYLFNGIKGYERMLNAVNRDVGVVADVANIYQAGDTITDFVKAFAGRFVHAHIKDITLTETNPGGGLKTLQGTYMNEVPIGEGIVPIKEVIDLLKTSGYNGYYGIEYTAQGDHSPLVNKALSLIDSWL